MIIEDRLPGGFTLTSTTAYQARRSAPGAGSVHRPARFFFNVLTGGHAPPFDNTQSQVNTGHADERGGEAGLLARSGR